MRMLGLRGQTLLSAPKGMQATKMAARPWLPSDCAEVTHWFDANEFGLMGMNAGGLTVNKLKAKSGSKIHLLPPAGLQSAGPPAQTRANRLFANNGTFEGDDNLAWWYGSATTDTGFDLLRQELFMCALTTLGPGGGAVCSGPGSLNGMSIGVTGPSHASGPGRPCVYVSNNQYFLDANSFWSFPTPRLLSATVGLGEPVRFWLDGVPVEPTSVGAPSHADPTPNLAYVACGYGGNVCKCSVSDLVGGVNMTEKDRQRTEGFMVWKAGLAHLLPPNHPYSRRRPT